VDVFGRCRVVEVDDVGAGRGQGWTDNVVNNIGF
jgi:hypothetical protein